jgi:hypothetical protein
MIPGLAHTMTVYSEDANGRFLAVAASGVRCRLYPANRQPGATGAARAELAAIRQLIWAPGVVVDEHAQIEVDSIRYNVAGPVSPRYGPSGALSHYEADVTRADNG